MCNILYPISLAVEEFSVYPVSRTEKKLGVGVNGINS
jgi:hypothetical protein